MAPPTEKLPPPDESGPSDDKAARADGDTTTGSGDDGTTATVPLARSLPPPGTGSTNVQMATVIGRLLRARGVSIYFALVLAGIALLAFSIRQAVIVMDSPISGVAHGKSGLIRSVDDRWPGVEHRDVIVAINGEPVPTPPDALPMLLATEPGPLTLRFARKGQEFERSAHTTPRSATEKIAIAFRIFIGALLLLSGAIAFLLRPGLRASWLGLLVAHAIGAFVLNEIAFHDAYPVLGARLQAVMITLTGALGIHFFSEFPTTVGWIRGSPHRSAWLYVPGVVLAAPFLAAFPSLQHITLWEASGIAIRVGLLVAALIIVGLLWHQYGLAKTALDQRTLPQCRALIAGVLLGCVLPAVWNVVRLAFGLAFDAAHAHFNTAPLIILVAITLYAYVRHNPMAVDRFTAAVVGYTGTLVVLIALFAGILVGLPLLVGREMLKSQTAVVIVTIIVVLTFAPVYRALKRHLDRWFFRDPVDLGRAVQLLQDLKDVGHDSDRDHALRSALAAATALRTDSAQLWTLSDDGEAVELAQSIGQVPADTPRELPRRTSLVAAIASTKMARGVDGLAARLFHDEAQEQLFELDMAAAAPVLAHGVFAGFLAVGRKRSGLAYAEEELSFLTAVASEAAAILETGRTEGAQLGRYRIDRRLGTGGMAEVFLAWQLGPGGFERKVALKRPLPHLAGDPDCLAMLFDEARIAAQLQHRNIVQIFEIDQRGGAYYIAMEHVDGPSVRRLLRSAAARLESVPPSVATAIAIGVLDALHHAHRQTDEEGEPLGVVHRDVTPANVLLTKRGEVKLTDFGIARAKSRLHATETGQAKGTLPYMSPEQARGELVDHRSDQFSLAVVLYEMVAGKRPFPIGPVVQHAKPELQLPASLPSTLRRLLGRALEFNPEKRFESAEQMRYALVSALSPIEPASELELAAWVRSLESK